MPVENLSQPENIPSTSSWMPPPSSSKNSEDDDDKLTTSLTLKPPMPSSTLSSQEHKSELESMSTFMTAGMENLNPQNDPVPSEAVFEKASARARVLHKKQPPLTFYDPRLQRFRAGAGAGKTRDLRFSFEIVAEKKHSEFHYCTVGYFIAFGIVRN
ncbi:hypothetical protein EVAR_82205_1 [Eumeta japonica]|uniref:Uncharacterized protein n=1 Tax=Eumeta variegata TaxID=151549 RepID=A0A4C1W3U7_EUMVA|nr:hypothetical protein EVAR_82205_1 [Eumeta japonica]